MMRLIYRDTTGAYARPKPLIISNGRIIGGRRSRATTVTIDGQATSASVALAAEVLGHLGYRRLSVTPEATAASGLDFLESLPPLHSLRVLRGSASDLGALAHHAQSLDELHLELGRSGGSLEPLAALVHLRRLYLRKSGSASAKAASLTLAQAKSLEHLVLHSISLPSIAPLAALRSLRGLALKLGGTPDLAAFSDLPSLRFFEAWQVRGLEDLRPVAASRTLEVLHLESLAKAELPDFSRAVSLAHVRLDNLPINEGLSGLAAAPSLRQLRITRRTFSLDELAPLRGHATLQAASIPLAGRQSDDSPPLGLASPHDAPFVAFGAGVMSLPPDGWDGNYLADVEPALAPDAG